MITRILTFFAVALLLVGSVWLANSSAAPASRDQHFGPFAITTPDNGSKHGSTVDAGVTGTFIGYVNWTVTGGIYNPAGCSVVTADCSTRAGFFTATFPGGVVGCGPSGVCKFGF